MALTSLFTKCGPSISLVLSVRLRVVVHLLQWTLDLCLCSGGQLAPRLSGSAGPGAGPISPRGAEFPQPQPEPELSGKQSLGR